MKIRIIGTMGSGKSYLAKILSKKLKIQSYDLDDLFWEKKYSKRRNDKQILSRIKAILKKKNWIIEGVQFYNHKIEKSFENADKIILLDPPLYKLVHRLILRYFSRIKNNEENAIATLGLIKGVIRYKLGLAKSKKFCLEMEKDHFTKIIRLNTHKQINQFLNNLK